MAIKAGAALGNYPRIKEQWMNHHPDYSNPDYDDLFHQLVGDEKDEGYTPRERPALDIAAEIRKQRQLEEEGYERARALIASRVKPEGVSTETTVRRATPTAPSREEKAPPSPGPKRPRTRVRLAGPASTAREQRPPTIQLPGAKGELLHHWEKQQITWTVQLSAQEMESGFKINLIRIQPWKQADEHLVTINGPGCGLSLGTKEAKALIGALQTGLKKIESKEFNPRKEGNFVPYKRNEK